MEISELNQFGKDILKELKASGVAPLPNNFFNQFQDSLDSKEKSFKEDVTKMIEIESGSSENDYINIETMIKNNQDAIKQMLAKISSTYKHLSYIHQTTADLLKKIDSIDDKDLINNLSNMNRDISDTESTIKKQIKHIQDDYVKSSNGVKAVFEDSIYEAKYQVFNKEYLNKIIGKELELIKSFGHESLLISFKIRDEILNKYRDEKQRTILNKTVSKLMLKVTRRSDFIFYYQKDIFMIVFKSMGIEGGKATSRRIQSIIEDTTFFVGEDELELKLSIGITKVDPEIDAFDNIKLGESAVAKAEKSKQMAHIVLDKNGEVSV